VGKAGLTLQADRDSRETGASPDFWSRSLGFALIYDSAHAAKWTELPFRAMFPVLACLVIVCMFACPFFNGDVDWKDDDAIAICIVTARPICTCRASCVRINLLR
jgi:hypothetical protein